MSVDRSRPPDPPPPPPPPPPDYQELEPVAADVWEPHPPPADEKLQPSSPDSAHATDLVPAAANEQAQDAQPNSDPLPEAVDATTADYQPALEGQAQALAGRGAAGGAGAGEAPPGVPALDGGPSVEATDAKNADDQRAFAEQAQLLREQGDDEGAARVEQSAGRLAEMVGLEPGASANSPAGDQVQPSAEAMDAKNAGDQRAFAEQAQLLREQGDHEGAARVEESAGRLAEMIGLEPVTAKVGSGGVESPYESLKTAAASTGAESVTHSVELGERTANELAAQNDFAKEVLLHQADAGDLPKEQRYLSGHGAYIVASGATVVPEGQTFTVYTPLGNYMQDRLGNAVESGRYVTASTSEAGEPFNKVTYQAGDRVPNYTLYPPDGLDLAGNPETVSEPTLLSNLWDSSQRDTHWVACTEVLDTDGQPVRDVIQEDYGLEVAGSLAASADGEASRSAADVPPAASDGPSQDSPDLEAAQQAEDAITKAQADVNTIHHIFDKPDHNWDATGLDQEDNLQLIREAIENNYEDIRDRDLFEVEEDYLDYTVTVRGAVVDGAVRIGSAWVRVP